MVAPLRIAHVTATFPPYRGGTGNVCYYNARELARRGHAVTVFTAAVPGAAACETLDGFEVRRLRPLLRVGNAPLLPQLVTALRGYDIIHLHYPFFGGEVPALAARLTNTPLVITYHQDVHLSGWMGLIAGAMLHTVGRWTLRSSQRLLFTSADYGQASCVRPLLKGRESIIGELTNGVDVDTFAPGPVPQHLRERYGLGREDQVVLLVAALDQAHYFKGVSVLLQALNHLPANVHAVIVGDGDLRQVYQAEAFALDIRERVTFAGRVSDGELVDHYRLADVTVLPSTTMGEAFGLVLLESLACGTPVVASNLPGVRVVVSQGHDGLLATPGGVVELTHKLDSILRLPNSKAVLGSAGRRKVELQYNWVRIGELLDTIYVGLLSVSK